MSYQKKNLFSLFHISFLKWGLKRVLSCLSFCRPGAHAYLEMGVEAKYHRRIICLLFNIRFFFLHTVVTWSRPFEKLNCLFAPDFPCRNSRSKSLNARSIPFFFFFLYFHVPNHTQAGSLRSNFEEGGCSNLYGECITIDMRERTKKKKKKRKNAMTAISFFNFFLFSFVSTSVCCLQWLHIIRFCNPLNWPLKNLVDVVMTTKPFLQLETMTDAFLILE